MSNEIYYSDATDLASMIRNRDVSPVEVMQAYLDRIAATNPDVNAIVTLAEDALKQAEAAEAAVMKGEKPGPLHGVPFTVKDYIDTAGVLTQRGSPIFKGRLPDADATSVPGGSSGGESAAIATGMSPLGLGTDLAISVRGPAAQTGITSMKATHGSVPMTGIWPRAPRRFWHVGPMARSVHDIALAFSQLSGPDGHDAFSSAAPLHSSGLPPVPSRPFRAGWMTGPGFGPVDSEVAAGSGCAERAWRCGGTRRNSRAGAGFCAGRLQPSARYGDEAGFCRGNGRSPPR